MKKILTAIVAVAFIVGSYFLYQHLNKPEKTGADNGEIAYFAKVRNEALVLNVL